MEPEGSSPCTQEPVPVPILSQINPVYAPHQTSRRSILIVSSHLRLIKASLKTVNTDVTRMPFNAILQDKFIIITIIVVIIELCSYAYLFKKLPVI